MIAGIGKDQTFDFVSSFDKTEPKTVFTLGNLPARYKEIFAVRSAEQVQAGAKEMNVSMVDVAIAGIRKIKTGDEVIEKIDENVINSIPFIILGEISKILIEKAFVSEDEKKN